MYRTAIVQVAEDILSSEDTKNTDSIYHHSNSNNHSIANSHFNCSNTKLNTENSSHSFSDQAHAGNALPTLTPWPALGSSVLLQGQKMIRFLSAAIRLLEKVFKYFFKADIKEYDSKVLLKKLQHWLKHWKITLIFELQSIQIS